MTTVLLLEPLFCLRWAEMLFHFLWQGTVIGLGALLITVLFPDSQARFRANLYLLSLVLMGLCLPITFFLTDTTLLEEYSREAISAGGPLDPIVIVPTAPMKSSPYMPYQPVWVLFAPQILLAHLGGVVFMVAHLFLRIRGASCLKKKSVPVRDPHVLEAIARITKTLQLRFTPPVAYCRQIMIPAVVGVFRPAILLPLSLVTGLTPRQIEMVLLHEMGHLSRYDHLTQLLQILVQSFLFFHPAVWMISKRLNTAREQCCDDLVIAAGVNRKEYASLLLHLAEYTCSLRNQPGLWVSVNMVDSSPPKSPLGERIARIFRCPVHDHLHPTVVPALFLFMLFTSFLLPIFQVSNPTTEDPETSPNSFQEILINDRSPDISPFAGVHWSGSTPIVNVGETWYELVSIDGLPVGLLVDVCKNAFRSRFPNCTDKEFWKRFGYFQHDLLDIMKQLGHPLGETVRLEVRSNGRVFPLDAPLTRDNFKMNLLSICPSRNPAMMVDYAYSKRSPFSGIRWEGENPIVHVQDQWEPLISIDDLPARDIVKFCHQSYGDLWKARFEEDLFGVLCQMGHEPGETVKLGLLSSTGPILAEGIPMSKVNRDAIARENDRMKGRGQ